MCRARMESRRAVIVWFVSSFLMVIDAGQGLVLPHLMTDETEHIQLEISEHNARDRHGRSTRSLPTELDVTLFIDGRNMILTLRRIADSDVSLPVHSVRNGSIVSVDMDSNAEFGFYEDGKRDALLLLERHAFEAPNKYTVFGTFVWESDRYLIQQSNTHSEDDVILHAINKLPDERLLYNDDVIYPETHEYKRHTVKRAARTKRQNQQYNIELYMVIDYSLYLFWKNRATGTDSQKDQEAKQNLRKFYSYVLYGIDQRYRGITDQIYTVRVISPGLLILDTPQDAPMTEQNKVTSTPRDIIGSSIVLDAFSSWVKSQTGLPQRDHTMLFTKYDIVSGGGGDSAGIAYVESLCSSQAQSVVEDSLSPFTMTTAAHELGHSLGADHDGTGNTCSSSSNYIMASVNSVAASPQLIQNLWIFSSCSVADFNSYINKLNRNNNNCMTETSLSSAFPASNQPMAEAYPPDDICVLTEGEGSFVCRSIQDYSTLCATMFCNSPGTSQCYTVMPPEGTSCGNGKICQKGMCVSSPNAPQVPDDCPLGDQPGILSSQSKTCAELVSSSSYRCYDSYVSKTCCKSCAALYTNIQGCEYGDKASWCQTLSRYQCYLNADSCCGFCNQPDIKDTSRPGCEYGDHYSNCDASMCPYYNQASKEGCCETCGTPTPIKTTTTTTSTTRSATTTASKTTSTNRKTTSTTTTSTSKSTSKTSPSSSTTEIFPKATAAPSNDSVIVGLGVGIGVVVVIIAIAITLFICYKRRHVYIRKHSKSSDNAYDKIGVMTPASQITMPQHPPPRREGSVTSPVRPPVPKFLNRGPLKPPNLNLHSTDGQRSSVPDEIDGYMTPNGVKVKTISNGVHYTAPDKPNFNFNLLNGDMQKSANISTGSMDSPNTKKKPKHYRRSAASNSSNDAENVNITSPIDNNPRSEMIVTKNRDPRDVLYDNSDKEAQGYNEISEVINALNQRITDDEKAANCDINITRVHKPIPKLPPRPKPRPNSVTRNRVDSGQESNFSFPLKPANETLAEKNVSPDTRPKVPLKPNVKNEEVKAKLDKLLSVEARIGEKQAAVKTDEEDEISSDIQDKHKTSFNKQGGIKPPKRPPSRPVPRRKTSGEEFAHDNPSFLHDTVINL